MSRSVEYDSHKNLHPTRDASLQDAREHIILFSTERGIPIGMPLSCKRYAILIFNPESALEKKAASYILCWNWIVAKSHMRKLVC